MNWKVQAAYHERDLLWGELNFVRSNSFIVDTLLHVLMFLLSIIIVTPVSLFNIVEPISDELIKNAPEDSLYAQVAEMLSAFWSPILIALVNVLILPMLVDLVALIRKKETKSGMQEIILKMNFFYMGLNMVLLPLTGLITIKEFMNLILEEEFNLISHIAGNLGNMASFFATYLMQVTFISNCIQMFDLPHFIVKNLKKFVARKQLKKFTDDWFFDLGYYQAYTATIMMMCLMFSVLMPIVTGFASCFFFFRFYIEKYNMLFVYLQDYESKAILRKSIVPYQIVAVTVFQLFNYTFITVLTGNSVYGKVGYGIIGFQLVCVYLVGKIHMFDPTFFMPEPEDHHHEV